MHGIPSSYAAIEGVSVVFYMDTMDSHPPDLLFCYAIIVQGNSSLFNEIT